MTGGLDALLRTRRGALDVPLVAAPGEVVVLLGPNGAGKTTALHALAGLVPLADGYARVGDVVLEDTDTGVRRPPYDRPVGLVPQDHLLFPHLSVLDNVAYGPRARGVPRGAARRTARAWLDRVGTGALADARPGTLSGGQAQRVSLARALATAPAVLLLDEPLAALDAQTRLAVRSELRRHLGSVQAATVLVTHDPLDAMVLADRLVVLEAGGVVQDGPPGEVVRRPRTEYVARLAGLNLVRGTAVAGRVALDGGAELVAAHPVDGPVHAVFRPSSVALFDARPAGSPRNVWSATVSGMEPHGDAVRVALSGPVPATADVTPAAVAELRLGPGSRVWASVKAAEVEAYPV